VNQLEQMKFLYDIDLENVRTNKYEELLSLVVKQTITDLKYDNFSIFLIEEDNLTLKAISSSNKESLEQKVPIGEEVIKRCAETKEIVNIKDVSQCDFSIKLGLDGAQSKLAVPIIFASKLLGVITTESQIKNAFTKEDELLLSILSNQLGAALKNLEIFKELKKLAITDGLTGLYNYRYFLDRLDEEIMRVRRYKRELSLILIDLDNFKDINDYLGHSKGNEILISISQLITENTRRVDKASIMKDEEMIIARYGGDEFMIILPETPIEGANVVAERLRRLIQEASDQLIPNDEKYDKKILLSASFGVVGLNHEETSDQFINRADQAMYEAKGKGKNNIHVSK